jgi:hypothetical protein
MEETALAPGAVHLTYATEVGGERTWRGSLRLRGADGAWRMRHHQGTPAHPTG